MRVASEGRERLARATGDGAVGLGGGGDGDGGEGLGGGGDGDWASRVIWTWTSTTDGVVGGSSMVIPNTLLSASRVFDCKSTAADSTWLAPPEVSVATTVRITLPALTVTVSSHAGKKHCSSWRKLAMTESAFASYSSTVPPAFSTKVISLADTISMTAPGCNGDGGERGGSDGGGGLGGGGASWWMVPSVLDPLRAAWRGPVEARTSCWI